MIDLDPKAWKAISGKFKIKDNGLEKALASYEKLEDDAHDECLKAIGAITQLANALKKAKEVSAAPEAGKFLIGLLSTADREKADVAKLKAVADKKQGEADKAQIAADKAKLAADKAKLAADKAKAEADKAEDDEQKEADGEEEKGKGGKDGKQDKGLKVLITTMLQKVKTARPDVPYQYLLCEAKPFPYLMIAKQINASHRKMLEKFSGGSKRFLKPGSVTFEDGHFCFQSDKNIPGAARRVQGFLKNLTGKKFPVMFGTQKATDEEDQGDGEIMGGEEKESAKGAGAEAAAAGAAAGAGADAGAGKATRETAEPALNMTAPFSISASVGQGGKNKPDDVKAVQAALNRRAKAGLTVDGKMGAKTIAAIKAFQQSLGKFQPDGLIEPGRGTARALASNGPMPPAPKPPQPAAPPKLPRGTPAISPDNWHKGLKLIQNNIDELKKAVRSEYASEHPDLLKAIEEALKTLDGIVSGLGTELAESIGKANAARDERVKRAELQNAKKIAAEKIAFVRSNKLIAHVDRNSFGLQTNIGTMTKDLLTHMVQAIGV